MRSIYFVFIFCLMTKAHSEKSINNSTLNRTLIFDINKIETQIEEKKFPTEIINNDSSFANENVFPKKNESFLIDTTTKKQFVENSTFLEINNKKLENFEIIKKNNTLNNKNYLSFENFETYNFISNFFVYSVVFYLHLLLTMFHSKILWRFKFIRNYLLTYVWGDLRRLYGLETNKGAFS